MSIVRDCKVVFGSFKTSRKNNLNKIDQLIPSGRLLLTIRTYTNVIDDSQLSVIFIPHTSQFIMQAFLSLNMASKSVFSQFCQITCDVTLLIQNSLGTPCQLMSRNRFVPIVELEVSILLGYYYKTVGYGVSNLPIQIMPNFCRTPHFVFPFYD